MLYPLNYVIATLQRRFSAKCLMTLIIMMMIRHDYELCKPSLKITLNFKTCPKGQEGLDDLFIIHIFNVQ